MKTIDWTDWIDASIKPRRGIDYIVLTRRGEVFRAIPDAKYGGWRRAFGGSDSNISLSVENVTHYVEYTAPREG